MTNARAGWGDLMGLDPLAKAQGAANPLVPDRFRVLRNRRELADTFTLDLAPVGAHEPFAFKPGQFNMLYQFGNGEVPISISGDPAEPLTVVHTIRAVGGVTQAMRSLTKGDVIGLRGPFGAPWPVDRLEGHDVVIIAGGIGLAPLRPAIYALLQNRERYGYIAILYGARRPEDILFRRQLEKWRGRFDLYVDVTVDNASAKWAGRVGVVTKLLAGARYDPVSTAALICGPEIMMRFAARELMDTGVAADKVYVSMERNMKCAVGFCGHCQFGGAFVCKDGPVFPYGDIARHLEIREF
ncbi:MAG: FAD/NAD(P)-binding protein [Magnetospiraceae bacterium]